MPSIESYKQIVNILEGVPSKMRPLFLILGASSAVGYHFYALDKERIQGRVEGVQLKQTELEEKLKGTNAKLEATTEKTVKLEMKNEAQSAQIDALTKENLDLKTNYAKVSERLVYVEAGMKKMQEDADTYKKFKLIQDVMEKQKNEQPWRNLFRRMIFSSSPQDAETIFRMSESDFRKGK